MFPCCTASQLSIYCSVEPVISSVYLKSSSPRCQQCASTAYCDLALRYCTCRASRLQFGVRSYTRAALNWAGQRFINKCYHLNFSPKQRSSLSMLYPAQRYFTMFLKVDICINSWLVNILNCVFIPFLFCL